MIIYDRTMNDDIYDFYHDDDDDVDDDFFSSENSNPQSYCLTTV